MTTTYNGFGLDPLPKLNYIEVWFGQKKYLVRASKYKDFMDDFVKQNIHGPRRRAKIDD